MPLGLAVLLVVVGVTAVVAALGYLIDNSAAARGPGENRDENGNDGGDDSGVDQHT
jgi:hypothetical protein